MTTKDKKIEDNKQNPKILNPPIDMKKSLFSNKNSIHFFGGGHFLNKEEIKQLAKEIKENEEKKEKKNNKCSFFFTILSSHVPFSN